VIDVTDEVLGAVDDEVAALLHGAGLHTAQIGTGLQRAQQLLGQHAGSFDFLLVRIQLLLHKIARGRDNYLLLFAEGKIHKLPLRAPRPSAQQLQLQPQLPDLPRRGPVTQFLWRFTDAAERRRHAQATALHGGQAHRESGDRRARGDRMALISSNDFINRFGDFLALLLYLFTPWTAINLIDFYIVRKGHYSIREIFNPSGMYGRLWHRLPRHDPILQYPDVPGTGGAR